MHLRRPRRSAIDEEGTDPCPHRTPAPATCHRPPAQGLYDPAYEHDACGVAFVATLSGVATHEIVDQALTALRNLDHRGASGAEPDSGDGAGILTQVPDAFLRAVAPFPLPDKGAYAVGIAFLPDDDAEEAAARSAVEALAAEEGLQVLGWRDVPTDAVAARAHRARRHAAVPAAVRRPRPAAGSSAWRWSGWRSACASGSSARSGSTSRRCRPGPWSTRGCSPPAQLEPFFPDLSDRRFVTELALVHSRFSTNTFPSWPLAHPYRLIAHNGEINTVKGNRNWMAARESQLASDVIPGDLSRLLPICTPGRERLGVLRRGARAAAPRRPVACRTRC